jgi:hypothetical protein
MLLLFTAVLLQVVTYAQHSPDFAEKFMSIHNDDSTLTCVTVSPKMMEQLVKSYDDVKPENIVQAIAKLKSARIVTGSAEYYRQAEELLQKNSQRFKAEQTYCSEEQHGAFYIRKDKSGNTVEFIMICEEPQSDKFVIVNLTGDIDEEFLCFLYNKKSFKN